ncbi:MAG: GH3 auxin-responsive promoter [Candidatus Aenigmatarchaeota archaeon]|nr:MAG: GH3 auxin-responsive promoter [Candidatus Aenigmarchaeota archaeon]
MATVAELLRQGRKKELWQRCCGFLDLSLEEFMDIQRRLLLEQLEKLRNCELGRRIMRGAEPRTVEEFREQVPLTTYDDYAPFLLEKREDVLPEKPVAWQRTAGTSDAYHYKWAPVTKSFLEEMTPALFGMYLLSICRGREDFDLPEKLRLLYLLAPPPYMTGTLGRKVAEDLDFFVKFIPPLEEAEQMPFEERVRKGFEQALEEGIDAIFGLASVLVAVGEKLSQNANPSSFVTILSSALSRPRLFLRLAKATVKSRLARRSLLPKDIWTIKGLMMGGTDAAVYKAKIQKMWGRPPLDVYGCTEGFFIAMQAWDYEGMTFLPHFNFLEFIPEDEHFKSKADPSYQPQTLLLDELEPGKNYEVVFTNFLGGPFIRYRIGDMIKITSLTNEKLGIDIPQMVFHTRVDGIIELVGLHSARLTEKIIWQAVENSGLKYVGWTARKEVKAGNPVLNLYLELEENVHSNEEVAIIIHEQLKRLNREYADLEKFLGRKPLEVTIIPRGAFEEYISKQRAYGADLAHLKPPHMNPPDNVIDALISSSLRSPFATPR